MTASLSIIVASSGRFTLGRTIDSARSQMRDGDEILVSVNLDCPWGHAARNQLLPAARATHLMFTDDDDLIVAGALGTIRAAVSAQPERVHIFKMRYDGGYELWTDREVRCGNVSTQMFVVPNDPDRLGRWGDRYEGDYDFLTSTLARHSEPPVWHPHLIALYRPC